jgi:hypothetical protein
MECPKCHHDADNTLTEEHLPCFECDCINIITYNICPQCKCVWRAANGVVINGSVADLGEMVSGIADSAEQLEFFEDLKADLHKHVRVKSGEAMMSDFVHRCLKCDSLAFPLTDHSYQCSSCGFEWEVFTIE